MTKSPLLLILLSSPQSVTSFARHHPSRRRPAASATDPRKIEQAIVSSLAYSFRQPDDDAAAYSEESNSSLLSNNGDISVKNGDKANGGSRSSSIINENDEMDIVGSGTLGDIMSGTPDTNSPKTPSSIQSSLPNSTTQNNNNNKNSPGASKEVIDGLVTKEGGELNTRFQCNFSPMERIALTSNGNLQRIFSSYYDAPVHVHIDFCERRPNDNDNTNGDDVEADYSNNKNKNLDVKPYHNDNNNEAIWDRIVHIHIHGTTICKATSIISVKDPECIRLIENGTIGLGQLFRYLNRLPTFSLVDAGRTTSTTTVVSSSSSAVNNNKDTSLFDGGIWRTYELKCDEMTCLIHEEFHKDAWNISPLDSNNGSDGPFQPRI